MAGEMFGAPAGISQAIQDEGGVAQADYVRGKTAMLPADLAHMQAQTRLLDAQTSSIPSEIAARQAKMRLDAEKGPSEIARMWAESAEHIANAGVKEEGLRKAKALSKAMEEASASGKFAVGPDGKPMSSSTAFAAIGMEALSVGNTEAAKEFLNQANLAWGHETSAERLVFDKRKQEMETDLKVYDLVGHEIPWVQNQQGLDALNQKIIKTTGKPPPWMGNPFSPQLRDAIEQSALTLKDRTTFQMKEEKALADQRQRDVMNTVNDLRLDIQRTQLDLQRERLERDKKAGVVADVSQHDVDAVMSMMFNENPDLRGRTAEDKSAAMMLAQGVAFDAKAMRLKNPGLSPEEARALAYQNRAGQLEETGGVAGYGTSLKYNPSKLGTRDQPIPYEDKKTERKLNKVYSVNGVVVRWAKKPDGSFGWKTVE